MQKLNWVSKIETPRALLKFILQAPKQDQTYWAKIQNARFFTTSCDRFRMNGETHGLRRIALRNTVRFLLSIFPIKLACKRMI